MGINKVGAERLMTVELFLANVWLLVASQLMIGRRSLLLQFAIDSNIDAFVQEIVIVPSYGSLTTSFLSVL